MNHSLASELALVEYLGIQLYCATVAYLVAQP